MKLKTSNWQLGKQLSWLGVGGRGRWEVPGWYLHDTGQCSKGFASISHLISMIKLSFGNISVPILQMRSNCCTRKLNHLTSYSANKWLPWLSHWAVWIYSWVFDQHTIVLIITSFKFNINATKSWLALHTEAFLFFFFFLKIFLNFSFRQREREGERGEKHQCVVASHTPPTGDLACNPVMCPDWKLNQQPFGSHFQYSINWAIPARAQS